MGKRKKRGKREKVIITGGKGGPDGKTSSTEQAVKIRRKTMNIYTMLIMQ